MCWTRETDLKNWTNLPKKESPDPSMPVGDVHFWLTGTNISASVHYDRDHNFFAQVVGKSALRFFSLANGMNYVSIHLPFKGSAKPVYLL